jgi:PAS domain-containing protein
VADALIAQVALATREGVVICDEDLRYVWANPAACQIMGYPSRSSLAETS